MPNGDPMGRKQNTELTMQILGLVAEGHYPAKIAKITDVGRASVFRKLKRMEQAGLIQKQSIKWPVFYELSEAGKMIAMENPKIKVLLSRENADKGNTSRLYGFENRGNIVHSSHKIKLSIAYEGEQPTKGAKIRPFGRNLAQIQAIYRQAKGITITAFKHRLTVWVHNPPGQRTEEQIREAKKEGYLQLVAFAHHHNIKLSGYLEKLIQSHHVVEDKALNEALGPIISEYGSEIQARIGSKICQTSHKGKVEHEGVGRPDRIVQGSAVAAGLEYLVLDFKGRFEEDKITRAEWNTNVRQYSEQIKAHLDAIKGINEGIRGFNEGMQKMNTLLEKMNARD